MKHDEATVQPAPLGQVERGVGRPAPERYVVRYLRDDYTLADAFRPDWSWGSKGYVVEAAKLGEHTDEDLIRIAHQTAPQGYWLQHIEAIGGEPHRRDVFKKSVLSSNRKPPNVQVSGPARSDGSA